MPELWQFLPVIVSPSTSLTNYERQNQHLYRRDKYDSQQEISFTVKFLFWCIPQ